ncbi:hypothetical protein SPONN_2743 [uncultured Candidatus Thioglobus sp.]|nr:hypothetical protein SPONN_2743 [uncultured Candidatus Thioglobus sp.]
MGRLFNKVADNDTEQKILPKLLTSENIKKREFINGYCNGKYTEKGIGWLNSIDMKKWNVVEKANLLKNLLPSIEVWKKVSDLLGEQEYLYWSEVDIRAYWEDLNIFESAIDKLLKYQRPNTVIDIISTMLYKKLPLDVDRSVKALLANREITKINKYDGLNIYHITEIIKALQQSPDVSQNDLFQIEWFYLANMDRIGSDVIPKTLENKIATEPDFFCELMQYAYKASNETQKKLNEQEKNRAEAAYKLLHNWETIPGFVDDVFSEKDFNNWLRLVKDKCKKSGRLDMALQIIGNTLIYTPKDKSELWINKTIAQALDSEDSKEMRIGFHTGIKNSRGVYTVNPTGEQEDELANKYQNQSNDLEQNGYINFAQTLKDVSNSYRNKADRTRNNYP